MTNLNIKDGINFIHNYRERVERSLEKLNEKEKQYFDYSKNGDYNYMVSCTCCYDYVAE